MIYQLLFYCLIQAVLNYPEKVEDLTREFIHAGSDVASAFVVSIPCSMIYIPL